MFMEWWLMVHTGFNGPERRGFDTLVAAGTWALWKQRNARVFNKRSDQKTAFDLP